MAITVCNNCGCFYDDDYTDIYEVEDDFYCDNCVDEIEEEN